MTVRVKPREGREKTSRMSIRVPDRQYLIMQGEACWLLVYSCLPFLYSYRKRWQKDKRKITDVYTISTDMDRPLPLDERKDSVAGIKRIPALLGRETGISNYRHSLTKDFEGVWFLLPSQEGDIPYVNQVSEAAKQKNQSYFIQSFYLVEEVAFH